MQSFFLGGGICIGSILLLGKLQLLYESCDALIFLFSAEEDQYEHYSRVLLKYFIAEGIMSGHSIILAGANDIQVNIINVR